MGFPKFLWASLFFFSVAFALTRQDLEQMKSELDNPITLEMLESILLKSGIPFEKQIRQENEYRGVCRFRSETLPIYVLAEFDQVAYNYGTDKEKRILILRSIYYGESETSFAYRFVNGRFQYNKNYYRPEKRKDVESIISKSNSMLDKIDLLNFACNDSTRCHVQTCTPDQLSDMLGSRGFCNGRGPKETCNYRLPLDDGETMDMTITYLNGLALSIIFNAEKMQMEATPTKTVKIGKQEWMDHNLLYGEGLTEKYGVDIVANKDLSNISDVEDNSCAFPSGERNGWFVFMDLHLRSNGKNYDFIEKPDIKENHQGVCPTGFHVPTFAEWKELFSFVAKDKVKFPKYELFDAYEKAVEDCKNVIDEVLYDFSEKAVEKKRKPQKKLESIEKELDVAYNKWRKGREDRFICRDGKKCRYDKHEMRRRIEEEIINHLCAKGAWPFDENGEDLCLDSYGFAMPSDSKKGNVMSYWTADAKVSQCHDVFENGRHQCIYDIEGYRFSIEIRPYLGLKEESSSFGFAYLRCIKNRSKK